MKFQILPQSASLNEIREVTKFAILPVHLNGEVRWMENVTIRYMYIGEIVESHNPYMEYYWKAICFVDEEKIRNMIIRDGNEVVGNVIPNYNNGKLTTLIVETNLEVVVKKVPIVDTKQQNIKFEEPIESKSTKK